MGGLGTMSADLLSAIGIGYLRIVDFDVVEVSNLPRQRLYSDTDIGKAKVDVAKDKLINRNPLITIDAHATKLDALSVNQLLEDIDLVIDGLDRFSTRKILFQAAFTHRIPYIFAGSIGENANIMTFTHKNDKPCLECILGGVKDDNQQTCEIIGVHPAILQIATGIQVTEGVKILLNQKSELEDKMLYIDLNTLEFEQIKFAKRKDCKICGTLSNNDLDKGKEGEITRGKKEIGSYGHALVTSLCGRDTQIIAPNWEFIWDFTSVKQKLQQKWHIAVSGESYVTINIESVGVSLMKSGVATIRGAKTSDRAVEIYTKMYNYIVENNT